MDSPAYCRDEPLGARNLTNASNAAMERRGARAKSVTASKTGTGQFQEREEVEVFTIFTDWKIKGGLMEWGVLRIRII